MEKAKNGVIYHRYNNISYYNCPWIYLYWDLYFCTPLQVIVWYPFISSCKTSCGISCRKVLVVTNSLSFSFSRSIFISSSLSRTVLSDTEFLADRLFFSTLNISTHSLLASKVSDRKSYQYWGFLIVCEESLLSWFFQNSLTVWFYCGSVWVSMTHPTQNLLGWL